MHSYMSADLAGPANSVARMADLDERMTYRPAGITAAPTGTSFLVKRSIELPYRVAFYPPQLRWPSWLLMWSLVQCGMKIRV